MNHLPDHKALLQELQELYAANPNISRREAQAHFKGRRGQTWINSNFPGGRSRTYGETDKRTLNHKRLKQMISEGYTVLEAVRAFDGYASESWVRHNWRSAPRKAIDNIYASQNIVPPVKQVPLSIYTPDPRTNRRY